MDDFKVKYFNKDDAELHLESLKNYYEISTDWEGHNYLGLTIYWNYNEEYVDISMPEYVKKALDRLQHLKPKISQYTPHNWTVPDYGKILHMAPYPDEINLIDKKGTNRIQYILGTMLYYDRSVDPTMLRAINEILRVP